jgi:hypothetical protein
MSTPTTLLPFQPASMSTAQLAAVSFLARYSGRTHRLDAFPLREWFAWCERNGLDPLVGVQRAHVELYIRSLGERQGTAGRSTRATLWACRGMSGEHALNAFESLHIHHHPRPLTWGTAEQGPCRGPPGARATRGAEHR